MNEIVKIETKNGINVVSSRTIAEQLKKRHSNVIRDIEKILTTSNLGSLIFASNYKDKKGELRKEYLLTKDGFTLYMFNIQGYNDFKMAYINKFNEMENHIKEIEKKQLETNLKQEMLTPDFIIRLATSLKEEQEKNKELKEEIETKQRLVEKMKPKASYYDLILQCKTLLPIRVIAKDYGMSSYKMNKLLESMKIQYKVRNQWFLYQKYCDEGYVASKSYHHPNPYDDAGYSSTHTYWTQKGRKFIYNLLKKCGILPVIERNIENI